MQHCAMPPRRPSQAWLWALGLSLAGHAALVLQRPGAVRPARAVPSLQTRQLLVLPLPQAPAARPPPVPGPAVRSHSPPASEVPIVVPSAPLALPAAGEWTYRLHQKGQEGIARLLWQPEHDRYELRLERELDGRPLPAWLSRGSVDAAGLAPLRFSHRRHGRDTQATNFRREEGLISFSASPTLHPLPPGTQDRLSWWLQLPARLAAAPQRWAPGSTISFNVAGLRGELQEWRFELVETDAEGLLQLRRAALGPYDGQLELWLDSRQAFRPVRLRLLGAEGELQWEMEAIDDKGISAQTSKFSVIP